MQEVIKVEHLSKSYGEMLAVDNVSLSVKRGTVFGLLGANGAGKSTTIECILGTKKANKGLVSILDCDPRKERRRIFQKVGVQFQECDYHRKSEYRNYVRKPLVSTLLQPTGENYADSLALEKKKIVR